MNGMTKMIFRGSVLTGAMILADGAVTTLCPGIRGIAKLAACLASVTICGAAADRGSRYAVEVLERAQEKWKG